MRPGREIANSSSWMLTGLGMEHDRPRITDIDPALFTRWLRQLCDRELTGTVQQP